MTECTCIFCTKEYTLSQYLVEVIETFEIPHVMVICEQCAHGIEIKDRSEEDRAKADKLLVKYEGRMWLLKYWREHKCPPTPEMIEAYLK